MTNKKEITKKIKMLEEKLEKVKVGICYYQIIIDAEEENYRETEQSLKKLIEQEKDILEELEKLQQELDCISEDSNEIAFNEIFEKITLANVELNDNELLDANKKTRNQLLLNYSQYFLGSPNFIASLKKQNIETTKHKKLYEMKKTLKGRNEIDSVTKKQIREYAKILKSAYDSSNITKDDWDFCAEKLKKINAKKQKNKVNQKKTKGGFEK